MKYHSIYEPVWAIPIQTTTQGIITKLLMGIKGSENRNTHRVIMNQLTQTKHKEEEHGEMLIMLMTGLRVCPVPGEPIFVAFVLSGSVPS